MTTPLVYVQSANVGAVGATEVTAMEDVVPFDLLTGANVLATIAFRFTHSGIVPTLSGNIRLRTGGTRGGADGTAHGTWPIDPTWDNIATFQAGNHILTVTFANPGGDRMKLTAQGDAGHGVVLRHIVIVLEGVA